MTLSRGMFCRFIGNDFAFLYQRENKMDKEKNQVITSAEKEDGTDSTATETTAAFTSVCESECDDYTTEGLVDTRVLEKRRKKTKKH